MPDLSDAVILETFRSTESPPASRDAASRLKTPPHSQEAEQALLGGLMLRGELFYDVRERLSARDFYHFGHRKIFAAMEALADNNFEIDVVTVISELQRAHTLDAAGGSAYLENLAENAPGVSNLKAYANIVSDQAILRQLIQQTEKISDLVFHPDGRDPATLLNDAEQLIFSIAEERTKQDGPRIINDILPNVIDRIHELHKTQSPITGLATGFVDLDEKTSGLQPADLIIVAGRPSMGKTSFAMNVAEHVAMQEDALPVVVFSMEMQAEALIVRLLASLARVDQRLISTGRIPEADWPRITSAVTLLKNRPLFIDDDARNVNQIRARARRIARNGGGHLGLVVIDYLQLMDSGRQQENRVAEISDISRNLKALAKELRCPLIALSQLNRGLEQRQNKRPQMADLRESGAIEQDADLILFIYRDEVYNKEDADNQGKAEIIISKQRNGPIGTIELAFLERITRFESLAAERYEFH